MLSSKTAQWSIMTWSDYSFLKTTKCIIMSVYEVYVLGSNCNIGTKTLLTQFSTSQLLKNRTVLDFSSFCRRRRIIFAYTAELKSFLCNVMVVNKVCSSLLWQQFIRMWRQQFIWRMYFIHGLIDSLYLCAK